MGYVITFHRYLYQHSTGHVLVFAGLVLLNFVVRVLDAYSDSGGGDGV